jgi:hypothetical protein
MSTQKPAWTHEEGLNFENARELITDLMGILSAEIVKEIDPAKIQTMRDQRQALSQERASLHVQNHAHIAQVMAKYGAIVRTHFEAHKLLMA